jgi:O-antigen/teichoic acid export membrane protein
MVLVLLLALRLIDFVIFLVLFSLSYLMPGIAMLIVLKRTGRFHLTSQISALTRRLKSKIINFGLFLFGAQFLNLLSRTVDTFIITSKAERGLADTAVFTIATYVVTFMEVPQRSMNSITVPILAESWRVKDMKNIRHIYTRSVTSLLIVGLVVFLVILLNSHNLAIFLGKDYAQIETVMFFLGLGKLVDLGTGANTQIIGTSNYWKVDFTTNVIYTLLALPLNYILISHWGLLGAAYSTVISLVFYNLMRYIFLWYKFGLQPYTWRHLLVLLLAFAAFYLTRSIPRFHSVVIDTVLRTTVFSILFLPAVYFTRISPEANQLVLKYAGRIRQFFDRPE